MAYTLLETLSDWDDDSILIVEVTPDGLAHVRDLAKRTIPNEPLPVLDAISRAQAMIRQNPWHREFMVRLQDGAKWDSSWGELRPKSAA